MPLNFKDKQQESFDDEHPPVFLGREPEPEKPRISPLVYILVILCVVGTGYLVYRYKVYGPGHNRDTTPPKPAAAAQAPPGVGESAALSRPEPSKPAAVTPA